MRDTTKAFFPRSLAPLTRWMQSGDEKRRQPEGGSGGGPGKPGSGPGNLRPSRGLFGFIMAIMVAVMLFLAFTQIQGSAREFNSPAEFETFYKNNKDSGGIVGVPELRDDGIYVQTTKFPGADGQKVWAMLKIGAAGRSREARKLLDPELV